jgi:hypothetical protein
MDETTLSHIGDTSQFGDGERLGRWQPTSGAVDRLRYCSTRRLIDIGMRITTITWPPVPITIRL